MADTKTKAKKTVVDPADDSKVTLVTKDGLKQLKEELTHLKDVKRREVAERLKEAISYGDLSENSEYEEAKNEQAFLEGRIVELEEKLKYVKIVEGKQHVKTVQFGTKVVVRNVKKGAEKEEYVIVGSTEANPRSAESRATSGSCRNLHPRRL